MPIFGAYSSYYNLIYRDKDYAGEVRYLHDLIQIHRPGAKSILDLGCGTGRHDLLLAQRGYAVTGLDASEEMLAIARANASAEAAPLHLLQGDIQTVRLGRTFDAVVSLFHVMSYQVTPVELAGAFATARAHMAPGAIFIFDCWYGPAVLADPPAVRVKRLEDEATEVTRIADPSIYPDDHRVDVAYQVFVRNKACGRVDELRETHRMRYWFRPELEQLLHEQGMSLVEGAEWMTGREPGADTWSVCFAASSTGE